MTVRKVDYSLKGKRGTYGYLFGVQGTPKFDSSEAATEFYNNNKHLDDLYKWSRYDAIVVAKHTTIEDEIISTL